MQKFLVISYDGDHDEAFYDWVVAADEDAAAHLVATALRSYCANTFVVDVFSAEKLTTLADEFQAASIADVVEDLSERVEALGSCCEYCDAPVRVSVEGHLLCECPPLVDDDHRPVITADLEDVEWEGENHAQ